MDMDEYKIAFRDFVLGKLIDFYEQIGGFYLERSGSPNSLSYFFNHFTRFEAMIEICLKNGITEKGLKRVCELGSWYPYTTYYFKALNSNIEIDLYDIITREIKDAEPYDVDGVKLIDFNLCTEELPKVKYDLIILSEVMEHIPMNLFALEKGVINLMGKGSYLVVTYPLGGKNAKDYEKDLEVYDFNKLQEGHIREFTEETTKLFFKELEKIDEVDITYPAYGLIKVILYRRGENNGSAVRD